MIIFVNNHWDSEFLLLLLILLLVVSWSSLLLSAVPLVWVHSGWVDSLLQASRQGRFGEAVGVRSTELGASGDRYLAKTCSCSGCIEDLIHTLSHRPERDCCVSSILCFNWLCSCSNFSFWILCWTQTHGKVNWTSSLLRQINTKILFPVFYLIHFPSINNLIDDSFALFQLFGFICSYVTVWMLLTEMGVTSDVCDSFRPGSVPKLTLCFHTDFLFTKKVPAGTPCWYGEKKKSRLRNTHTV